MEVLRYLAHEEENNFNLMTTKTTPIFKKLNLRVLIKMQRFSSLKTAATTLVTQSRSSAKTITQNYCTNESTSIDLSLQTNMTLFFRKWTQLLLQRLVSGRQKQQLKCQKIKDHHLNSQLTTTPMTRK